MKTKFGLVGTPSILMQRPAKMHPDTTAYYSSPVKNLPSFITFVGYFVEISYLLSVVRLLHPKKLFIFTLFVQIIKNTKLFFWKLTLKPDNS